MYIKVQGQRAIPMDYALIGEYAADMAGHPLGATWPKRFVKRHNIDLKTKKTAPLEKARAKALNKTAVQEFYQVFGELIEKYGLTPGDIYNMDKKGFQLGIGQKAPVVVDRNHKTAYVLEAIESL
jgi:hypothetical protein